MLTNALQPFLQRTFLPDATTPPALAPALVAEIPEIELALRLFPSWGGKYLVRYGEKVFYEEKRMIATSAILKMFTYEFVEGDAETALSKPKSVVISQTLAKKYFGNESPLGKTLEIGEGDNRDAIVAGVIRDVPENSHFHFD